VGPRPRGHGGRVPVFGTIASRFNDDGTTALYGELRSRLADKGLAVGGGTLAIGEGTVSSATAAIVPGSRRDYLADIAEVLRRYRAETERMATAAQRRQAVREVAAMAEGRGLGAGELAPLASAAEDELGNEGAGCSTSGRPSPPARAACAPRCRAPTSSRSRSRG